QREHAVLQCHAGVHDADGSFPDDRPGTRHRRQYGGQAHRRTGSRHVSDRWSLVLVLSRERHRDPWCADVLPGARARSCRRAFPRQCRSISMSRKEVRTFDPTIVKQALRQSFAKLAPKHMVKNPVMFVVEIGSVLTSALCFRDAVATDRMV